MGDTFTVRPTRLWAGQRRHYAALEEARVVTDTIGGRKALTWDMYGRWWVAIVETPFLRNEQEAAQTYKVIGPWRRDIPEKHAAKIMQRVVVPGKTSTPLTLRVVIVQNPDQRNRDLILHCVEAK